jgi:hypothetical protein
MVCLLLVFSLVGIFGFVRIKKNKKAIDVCLARVSRSIVFWWRMQLAPVVVTMSSSWHPLFLWKVRAWWFDVIKLEIAFIFLLFLLRIAC